MTDPIERWHAYVESRDPARLDVLLAEEVVFRSPAVHRPQEGRAITTKYLNAAMTVLNNDAFRYAGEWRGERSAVLRFRTVIDGVEIDGIDMIDWDEAGRIVAFTVMVRPIRGLNKLVERMAAELAR